MIVTNGIEDLKSCGPMFGQRVSTGKESQLDPDFNGHRWI